MSAAPRVLLLALLAVPAACQRSDPGTQGAIEIHPLGRSEAGGPPAPAAREDLAHFEGVIDQSRQTLDRDRSDLYVRAAGALDRGDAKAAEALYREAIARYPSDPNGYEALGTCLSFQERHEEARAEYERALRLAPASRDALYGLGCVAYHQKCYREAVEHLEAVLAAREGDAPAHRVLALAYDDLGDGPKALAHYTRAAELDPKTADEEHVRRRIAALRDRAPRPR
jgi:tetratricopeptide (TPR) repeat protein